MSIHVLLPVIWRVITPSLKAGVCVAASESDLAELALVHTCFY